MNVSAFIVVDRERSLWKALVRIYFYCYSHIVRYLISAICRRMNLEKKLIRSLRTTRSARGDLHESEANKTSLVCDENIRGGTPL